MDSTEILRNILHDNPTLRPAYMDVQYRPSPWARAADLLRRVPVFGTLVSAPPEHVQRLLARQKTALTYNEWHSVSAQLDSAIGNDLWKASLESPYYDHELVQAQVQEMQQARLLGDYSRLLYVVRTKWSRNFANMGDPALYRHCHVGTKDLIEAYVAECQAALHFLVHNPKVHLDDRYLLGILIQTRKNIGRTALMLLGGLTFGVSHIGVLIALLENNLLPRVILGSSAGLVIASILCSHTNDELEQLLAEVLDRPFVFFGLAPTEGGRFKSLLARISHLLKYGTVFDISGVRDTVHSFVGDLTFREAYNRTGKILNITVSPASMHEQTRLLNYLTAPHCLIWSAVCALCLVPGIFPSNSIYEKIPETNAIREWNNDQLLKYVDGSVDGDLPITRLSEMFNVDHIIAVQVNPHVSPVLQVSVGSIGGQAASELANTLRNFVNSCYDFCLSEIIHYLQILHELDIQRNLTSKLIAVLTQRYLGDITILPELDPKDYLELFSDPSPEFLLRFILKGAKAAWPKITIINNHCGVEFALDKEISALRGRIISSSNNMLPYSTPKSSAMPMLAAPSNTYLISAPILDTVLLQEPVKERRSSPVPRIRRHNSIGSGSLVKKKGVLVEGPRRKLTDATVAFAPNRLQLSYKSDANIAGLARESERSVKKTTSLNNFQLDKGDRSPNPFRVKDKSLHAMFDYENFNSRLLKTDGTVKSPRVLEKDDKPNLPKLTKDSSNNSYVGLNLSKSKQSSTNGSSQNLKDFYTENEAALKSLTSSDLRRLMSRTRVEDDSFVGKNRVSFKSSDLKPASSGEESDLADVRSLVTSAGVTKTKAILDEGQESPSTLTEQIPVADTSQTPSDSQEVDLDGVLDTLGA